MRKTNQPEKSGKWSGPKWSHIFAASFSSERHTLPANSVRQAICFGNGGGVR
jgi:hypothetical protein